MFRALARGITRLVERSITVSLPLRTALMFTVALVSYSLLMVTSQSQRYQSFDRRAREMVREMTLEEEIQELHGELHLIQGVRHYRYVPPVPLLGIPVLQMTNGPAGAGPGATDPPDPQAPATALPAPISLAATWDTTLARQYGVIAGAEARDLGNVLLEGPAVDLARVPQNGRTFEGYGEDPYLAGQISAANIQGIQSQGVMASVKHFVANNQEANRRTINEEIDERTLREIYLPAFETSIRQGQSASLMCAYPRINGTFNCEDSALLNDIVKKEWNFSGFILSDFGAVHSSVGSALAGVDLEMPTGEHFGDILKAAVKARQVRRSVIEDKLVRRLRVMMQFGVFDAPPSPRPIPAKADGARSRAIAAQGMVLLKNSGRLLPLQADHLTSIALLGPLAAKAVTGGDGSSRVMPLYTVSPEEGIRQRAPQARVAFADGTDLAQAAALARAAEVAIVMVGEIDGEGVDHPIVLGGNQDRLVEAVAAANPRTIVVLKSGSAVLLPWVEQVPAILEAWYPGEEDGSAVADVLFGEVNPSGKLPITFPRRLADVPASTPQQYPGINGVARYSEGVFVGYRHYDEKNIAPLFPFGHGLSYTSFRFGHLTVSPTTLSVGGERPPEISVQLEVHNSGRVAGAEVVELYLAMPSTVVPQPPRQLKGFQKVFLKPGETAQVQLLLDARALSFWDVSTHSWQVAPGPYKIMVGASSRDTRLSQTVRVSVASQGNGKSSGA